jgi:hypothetical protein
MGRITSSPCVVIVIPSSMLYSEELAAETIEADVFEGNFRMRIKNTRKLHCSGQETEKERSAERRRCVAYLVVVYWAFINDAAVFI